MKKSIKKINKASLVPVFLAMVYSGSSAGHSQQVHSPQDHGRILADSASLDGDIDCHQKYDWYNFSFYFRKLEI